MASPLIGEVALWTALKAFVVAASVSPSTPAGIPAASVYRAQQNAPEIVGTPASVRLWSDDGAIAVAQSWQSKRTKLLERWLVQVLVVAEGSVYEGEVLATPFDYTAQVGDDAADIRAGLIAALPGTVTGATSGTDSLTITAQTVGVPLAVSVSPAELLAATRTRKTASETKWCPAEITVQIEVVSERPRDDPDSVPSAMAYLDAILGKLHHELGPHLDLHAAGVGFVRFAMQPEDLTGLDRARTRSRARADVVFSVDVGSYIEFDVLAELGEPAGEVEV